MQQYRKLTFSLIALVAITASMFKMNVEDAVFSPVSHKPFHPTKTVFDSLHTSSVLLLLEMDSEEALDGEETDEELKHLAFEFDLFTQVTFAALERAATLQAPDWEAASVKGHYAPIYLLHRNFRL